MSELNKQLSIAIASTVFYLVGDGYDCDQVQEEVERIINEKGWEVLALKYARGEQEPATCRTTDEELQAIQDAMMRGIGIITRHIPATEVFHSGDVPAKPPAKPAESEAVRGLVEMLQIARQSMLDSGYNPRSSIIHACDLALKKYEEATKS